MRIEFTVHDLPPKKDGANSMWGKGSTELVRIQKLRKAAREKLGAQGPFRTNVALEVELHVPENDLARVGDLDNFITGICDGLMRAAGVQRDVRWEGDCWDGLQPCDVVGIEDDSHVVSIIARKVGDEGSNFWYRVVLEGDR
jgi:hypothetical protein